MAWVVGIDLGTTHTAVAVADLDTGNARPSVTAWPVPQRVSVSARDARALLPSCLFAPPTAERREGDPAWIVGVHARDRGAEVPGRLVASSKSWLAHAAVDRTAAILPWGVDDREVPRMSPVDAAAALLEHVRLAWDEAHPDAALADQSVVLTVPASFDEVARALTTEATRKAGLRDVRLLEEPQAAFLDWLRLVGEPGLAKLGELEVLVCDIGGGTTDFSLLRVQKQADAPAGVAVTRVAVGEHLLLGGDNVDLALAHHLEPAFVDAAGEHLAPLRFSALVHAARAAKEQLLADGAPPEAPVTLLGQGSRLIGGSRRATLTRAALDTVLAGFLPDVQRGDGPVRARRSGLVSVGLPYASDAAMTRHLAGFLARHARLDVPLGLLFNGGVFHARAFRERVVAATTAVCGVAPVVLEHGDPDLAVARGAAAYGLSLRGLGRRIGGGSPRSYWIGVERDPAGGRRAVCVVPKGSEPGDAHVVEGRAFALTVGRATRFDLFATTGGAHVHDRVGDLTTFSEDDEISVLPPVVTLIQGDPGKEIPVRLSGELSEVGTLQLACVEPEGRGRRYRLDFELRREAERPAASLRPAGEDRRLADARARIDAAFTGTDPRDAKNLVRELERQLGEKGGWPSSLVRPLFDTLIAHLPLRTKSVAHERAFFSLAGFLLRPGFGDPMDALRIKKLEPLWKKGLAHDDQDLWRAYWICWRRIAAGLSEQTQGQLRDTLDPFLEPKTDRPRKKPKGVRAEPFDEVLMLASHLERVPAARREELGKWILERTWTSNDPRLYAAIGRLGARVPAYASAHHCVPARVAEEWLSEVITADFREIPGLAVVAAQLARKTGDRARDVSERARGATLAVLTRNEAAPALLQMVREVVESTDAERREAFGEALPSGLRLIE